MSRNICKIHYNLLLNISTRSIMQGKWFWMSGDSMRFTYWSQDSPPPIYSNPCGGMDREGQHMWEEQPCEEPLNFICQSGRDHASHVAWLHMLCIITVFYSNQLSLVLRSPERSAKSVFLQHQEPSGVRAESTRANII